jgi:hypothetical protein
VRRHRSRSPRLLAALLAGLALLGSASGAGAEVDWPALAGAGPVHVITRDADGAERRTKIWLVVVDGAGYVRTGGTRWGDNLMRDPAVRLEVEGGSHALRGERVGDEALLERVTRAFREKYGTSDRMAGWFRFGEVKIFRLLPDAPG